MLWTTAAIAVLDLGKLTGGSSEICSPLSQTRGSHAIRSDGPRAKWSLATLCGQFDRIVVGVRSVMGVENPEPCDVLYAIERSLEGYFCYIVADQACYTLRLLPENE